MSSVVVPERSLIAQYEVYLAAIEALRCGINVLPIAGDGSKRPPLAWKRYQSEPVTLCEVERWFLDQGYPGLAFVTGAISENLEVLDFDDRAIYRVWREQMRSHGLEAFAERLTRGYLEASPQGLHLLYRCRVIEGNLKLAGRKIGPTQQTTIETRGEAGLVVVAPSAGGVHRSKKPYQLLCGGPATIQWVTVPERQMLLAVARSLDELPRPEVRQPRPCSTTQRPDRRGEPQGERPGHLFNRQASWEEVLVPHGWRLLDVRDSQGYWTKHQDVHATTNYRGNNLLYVFSTATIFEAQQSYSKFAAYTLLNYGSLNDTTFAAAARELARRGYTSS